MNTHTLKLLVTVSTSLALGGVLGWWGKSLSTTTPPSLIPYAIERPAVVAKGRVVTKVIPGKPGDCPTVETSATVDTTTPAGKSYVVKDAYALGLSAQPRLGVPHAWRLDAAVRLGNSPLMVTGGVGLYQNNLTPDVGLRLTF